MDILDHHSNYLFLYHYMPSLASILPPVSVSLINLTYAGYICKTKYLLSQMFAR